MSNTVRVWDLPTRLFHWLLVLCVIALVVTGYADDKIALHALLGYTVLALLLFRLVWGFAGGRWSRFASFIYAPSSLWRHLRGQHQPEHEVGHNPLGALSVFALLLVLLVQVGTGLISDDEIAFTGPLNRFVSNATGLSATWYHADVGQWLLIGLATLHVLAILFYFWRKHDNLVTPMLTGDKACSVPMPSSRDDALTRLGALVILAVCAGVVLWIVRLGG